MNIIHCIDYDAAKKEQFKFKADGVLYNGHINIDGDCIDSELVDCSGIGSIEDEDGNNHEWLAEDDYLIDDVSELLDQISWSSYMGSSETFKPFTPDLPGVPA